MNAPPPKPIGYAIPRSITPIREPTPRQLAVAELLYRNLTYREIGETLGIAEATVSDHVEKFAMLFPAYHESEGRLTPWQIVFAWMLQRDRASVTRPDS